MPLMFMYSEVVFALFAIDPLPRKQVPHVIPQGPTWFFTSNGDLAMYFFYGIYVLINIQENLSIR